MLVWSKNQSLNYFTKLPPNFSLIGSYLWPHGPVPLPCPKSDPTRLMQEMLVDYLVFSLLAF